MLTAKERFHTYDLVDKIIISWNEIPLESITLSNFKYWCDLLIFEKMVCYEIKIIRRNMDRTIFMVSVKEKFMRFLFRGLIHFKKMNIKVVDANIIAKEIKDQGNEGFHNSYKENFLMLVTERIKNCETTQDLIDGSPNKECPVCMDVTFTEATPFVFRLSCNHLLCHSCEMRVRKINRLVEKIYYFYFF